MTCTMDRLGMSFGLLQTADVGPMQVADACLDENLMKWNFWSGASHEDGMEQFELLRSIPTLGKRMWG